MSIYFFCERHIWLVKTDGLIYRIGWGGYLPTNHLSNTVEPYVTERTHFQKRGHSKNRSAGLRSLDRVVQLFQA